MSPGEVAFLSLAVGALVIFAIALAYASWVTSGNAPPERQRQSKPRRTDAEAIAARYTNDRERERAA